ncbi:MAG: hypothetical protein A2Y34_01035 [Spirochaetes bacterium GWC1_27_15]|nr:MAG: hypothetical protein A2Z98_02940 [Spirochaetes bacterium GWB1_27_13]OHD22985.1 MAG: hypothetical protein A2Y34_01035 [Spirochaetes bacterium GWC1_27_15]
MNKILTMIMFSFLLVVFFTFSFFSCQGETSTTTTTVASPSVTVNLTGADIQNGKKVYVILIGGDLEVKKFSSATIENGKATIVLNNVSKDTYVLNCFIDVNENANTAKPEPDTGDKVSNTNNFSVDGNKSQDITYTSMVDNI